MFWFKPRATKRIHQNRTNEQYCIFSRRRRRNSTVSFIRQRARMTESKHDPVQNLLISATDRTIETLTAKLGLLLDNSWRSTDADQYRFFAVHKLRPIRVSEYFTRSENCDSAGKALAFLARARIQTLLPATLSMSDLRGFRFESATDDSGKLYLIPVLWYLPPTSGTLPK